MLRRRHGGRRKPPTSQRTQPSRSSAKGSQGDDNNVAFQRGREAEAAANEKMEATAPAGKILMRELLYGHQNWSTAGDRPSCAESLSMASCRPPRGRPPTRFQTAVYSGESRSTTPADLRRWSVREHASWSPTPNRPRSIARESEASVATRSARGTAPSFSSRTAVMSISKIVVTWADVLRLRSIVYPEGRRGAGGRPVRDPPDVPLSPDASACGPRYPGGGVRVHPIRRPGQRPKIWRDPPPGAMRTPERPAP